MKKKNSSFCLRALALMGLMIFMMAGLSVSAHAAANASIANGYYVIQSGNSAQMALDVSGASMSNGANLILYKKNTASPNQIFYVKKESNGYYTFRAVHSGSYLHKYNTSTNVVQWSGLSNNAYWQIQIAGNGYYYIRHRNGLNLDNSGGRTTLGNNVWLFLPNGTNAQKWKLVPVSRPSLSLSLSNVKNPSGTYNNPTAVTASGTISSNYPITKVRYGIYDSKGTAKTTTTKYPNAKSFTYGFKINVSSYPAGQYFFGIDVMNVGKEQKKSSRYYFTIKRQSASSSSGGVSVNSVQTSSKGLQLLIDMERPVSKKYCKYDKSGKVTAIKNADIGDGGITVGYGSYFPYVKGTKKLSSSTVNKYKKKYGIDISNLNEYVKVDICMKLFQEEISGKEAMIRNYLKKKGYSKVKQNVFDAMVIQAYNGYYETILNAYVNDNVTEKAALETALNQYSKLKGWGKYKDGWTNRLKATVRVAKRGIYKKDY